MGRCNCFGKNLKRKKDGVEAKQNNPKSAETLKIKKTFVIGFC